MRNFKRLISGFLVVAMSLGFSTSPVLASDTISMETMISDYYSTVSDSPRENFKFIDRDLSDFEISYTYSQDGVDYKVVETIDTDGKNVSSNIYILDDANNYTQVLQQTVSVNENGSVNTVFTEPDGDVY